MGRWEPISDALYATEIHRCELCGQMLVRRRWRVEYGGRILHICGDRCERTWLDYWLPRYGKSHGFTDVPPS